MSLCVKCAPTFAALYLAPLVKSGLIESPIDVYDAGQKEATDIGVGIWSTALDGFRDSVNVESHQIAYKFLMTHGTLSKGVGFRSPRGDWLAESNLSGDDTPDLLFLKEKDIVRALQLAVHHEVLNGNIVLHSGSGGKIVSIAENSPLPWSAPLEIEGNCSDEPSKKSKRDYHLIIAADGMNSILRRTYGGHASTRRQYLGYSDNSSGTASDGPLDLPNDNGITDIEETWAVSAHAEATGTQDRQYHVFRGNSPVSRDKVDGLDKAFQTWGECGNMRFATVPIEVKVDGTVTKELHTWFITIDDSTIASEIDPNKRKELLLKAFKEWHDPIRQLVEATPSNDILMDRAMAHKHSCEPVVNFNGVVHSIRKKPVPSIGDGPVLLFIGDAFMTVDPILAQGFTFGMEGAAAVAQSLILCLDNNNDQSFSIGNSRLSFDPYFLRKELLNRYDRRLNRLICLLRSSELIQAFGQPIKGSFTGWISRTIIRPLMRVTPNFIKTPIFNRVMMYSLGLHLGQKNI